MNDTRRNFLKTLGGIGLFAILPGAGRIWKAEKYVILPNPGWLPNNAELYNRLPMQYVVEATVMRPEMVNAFERLLEMKPFLRPPDFRSLT